jgi:putative hemolysin
VAIALTLAAAPAAVGSSHQSDAEEYCSKQGGQVIELKPTLFPDSDSQLELGGSLHVCQFISQDGDNPVQLIVDLTTLHSEMPTLAGLAYLSNVRSSNSGPAGSNPAASYCPDDLGGTEQFGTAAAGAWVGALDPGMEAGDTEPLGDTVNLCVFADRSAIDEFGLFYASDGAVRGIDLSTVMRYQPDGDLPDVFATGS